MIADLLKLVNKAIDSDDKFYKKVKFVVKGSEMLLEAKNLYSGIRIRTENNIGMPDGVYALDADIFLKVLDFREPGDLDLDIKKKQNKITLKSKKIKVTIPLLIDTEYFTSFFEEYTYKYKRINTDLLQGIQQLKELPSKKEAKNSIYTCIHVIDNYMAVANKNAVLAEYSGMRRRSSLPDCAFGSDMIDFMCQVKKIGVEELYIYKDDRRIIVKAVNNDADIELGYAIPNLQFPNYRAYLTNIKPTTILEVDRIRFQETLKGIRAINDKDINVKLTEVEGHLCLHTQSQIVDANYTVLLDTPTHFDSIIFNALVVESILKIKTENPTIKIGMTEPTAPTLWTLSDDMVIMVMPIIDTTQS